MAARFGEPAADNGPSGTEERKDMRRHGRLALASAAGILGLLAALACATVRSVPYCEQFADLFFNAIHSEMTFASQSDSQSGGEGYFRVNKVALEERLNATLVMTKTGGGFTMDFYRGERKLASYDCGIESYEQQGPFLNLKLVPALYEGITVLYDESGHPCPTLYVGY